MCAARCCFYGMILILNNTKNSTKATHTHAHRLSLWSKQKQFPSFFIIRFSFYGLNFFWDKIGLRIKTIQRRRQNVWRKSLMLKFQLFSFVCVLFRCCFVSWWNTTITILLNAHIPKSSIKQRSIRYHVLNSLSATKPNQHHLVLIFYAQLGNKTYSIFFFSLFKTTTNGMRAKCVFVLITLGGGKTLSLLG